MATVLASGRPALAQEATTVPDVSIRVFGGLAAGGGVQLQPQERLRVDLSAARLVFGPFDWGAAALVVRVTGGPRRFLGIRGGYQLEYSGADSWTGPRFAHAVDAGLVARSESAAGSALEGQLGLEGVFRSAAAAGWDDAPLPTSSAGLRAALTGELAVWRQAALLAEAELRMAAHLSEVRYLPTAQIGFRYRF